FLDANRGWAVGAMGQVLATRDGGASWYLQRQPVRRVGVLAIVDDVCQTPWTPLVAAACENRLAVAALAREGPHAMDQADFLPSAETLLVDVAPGLGLARYATLAGRWDPDAEQRRLVVELLSMRPDVVLAGSADSDRAHHNAELQVGRLLVATRIAAAP